MNKKFIFKTLLSIFILLAFYSVNYGQVEDYRDIKYPKLRKFDIPEPDREVLKNGMILYMLEDHELPLIEISAKIRTGGKYEPADRIGLASITGTVMRTGGTTSMIGEEIDEKLESMAASVETWIGTDNGGASVSCLKENFDEVLAIFADVLMNPVFDQDKIDLAVTQQKSAISRRNDDVGSIAWREFSKLVYGPESPYARTTEYETINNITRDDLIEFHKKYFHPNNVILGIVGDFKKKEVRKKIEEAFKNWKPVETELPKEVYYKKISSPTINYIEKKDVNQTNIRIGHLGITVDNPDYFALRVLSDIFGSGFSSRLFSNIRSEKGLAYHISGYFGADYDHPGLFTISGETKSETTMEMINAIFEEIDKIVEGPVGEDELKLAKDRILNSFIFNFDSPGKIIERQLTYEYYGYPKDFLKKYRDEIEKVTIEDVQRVAKKYIHRDQLTILAVGNEEDFDQPLSVLGKPVNIIDITIPRPAKVIPEATSETLARGKKLILKTADALGGIENIRNINDIKASYSMKLIMPQGEATMDTKVFIKFPDKIRQEMNTPMGQMVMVLDGENGWLQSPRGIMSIPPSQKEEMQNALFREISLILKNIDSPEYKFQYLGEEDVEGVKADVVLVSHESGMKVELIIGKEDHIVLRERYESQTMMGVPAETVEIFSEYREIAGVKFPFRNQVMQEGKIVQDAIISKLEINSRIDDALFKKE